MPVPLLIAGGVAAAGGAAMSAAGGNPKVKNDFLQNPEYKNSQDARDLWWQKLQDWGKDPNYGAISPDWNNIWDQTQKQVRDYYNGTALTPGVQNRVTSALARRGMSENPASDFLHAQVGAAESRNLGDLSAQQDIVENAFSEQGRNTWLNSLANFQAQKPTGQWQTQVSDTGLTKAGNALSQVGGAVGSYGVSAMNSNTLANAFRAPTSYDPAGGTSAWDWSSGKSSFLN